MKRLIATFVASLVLIAIASANTTSAQDPRAIYYAADQYREAVHHFEDEAQEVQAVDRFTLRLIDRLEDQTSDVRSAARRVEDPTRLFAEFNEVSSLQASVGEAVFASGCPIVRRALSGCWNEVLVAHAALDSQVRQLQSRYGVGYRGQPSCDHHAGYAPQRSSSNPNIGYASPWNARQAADPFRNPSFESNRHEALRYQSSRPSYGSAAPGYASAAPAYAPVTSTYPPASHLPPATSVPPRRGELGAMFLSGLLSRAMRDR